MKGFLAAGVMVSVLCAQFAMSGCASKLGYEVSPARPHPLPVVALPELVGRVAITDGSTLELSAISGQPAILIFSQDTCLVCGHEANALRDALPVAGQEPTRVRLVTVLVGAVIEDAQDWKDDHRIPWAVGIDPDSSLFAQYCAQRTVPCNVVFLPKKGVVLSKNGPMSAADLTALTGSWEEE